MDIVIIVIQVKVDFENNLQQITSLVDLITLTWHQLVMKPTMIYLQKGRHLLKKNTTDSKHVE